MSHPMEGYYDELRASSDRLWARRDALFARLSPAPLAAFTVAHLADLALLVDRSAPSERKCALIAALDRLEAAFPEKPARAARRNKAR
jgi:hypothetical protein